MKITNKLNLPKQFEQIAQDFYQYKNKQFSVTAIIGSIRELLLKKRYNEEIEVDCSELLYALFGQALHKMMEEYKEGNDELTEEYLIEQLPNGYKLSGRLDLYNNTTKTIIDYKTCSVWSIIYKSDNEKWKKQLLIYAWLLRKAGFEVEKGEIIAMMRDWKKSEVIRNSSYPKLQVEKITFNFTEQDFDEIEQYIYSRFKEIEYYENNPTEVLPMCSNEERFREPDKYAIMKKGAKRAIKLYDNHEDAKNHASTDDNLYIEVRPGTDKKCLEYCNVCQFCDYWKNNYKDKEVK